MTLDAFWLSFQVTIMATMIVFIVGLGLAAWLTRVNFRGKSFVWILLYLPLVLPPSVVGYYLLLLLGRHGPFVQIFDLRLLFTVQAAVIASAIVALPLMVQSSRAAVESVNPTVANAARLLGSSEWRVWWTVTFPLARRGIIAGTVLSAARALGEFGATLMVAGNLAGRTQTVPLAIYDAIQAGRMSEVHLMVIIMTILSFLGLWVVDRLRLSHRVSKSDA